MLKKQLKKLRRKKAIKKKQNVIQNNTNFNKKHAKLREILKKNQRRAKNALQIEGPTSQVSLDA